MVTIEETIEEITSAETKKEEIKEPEEPKETKTKQEIFKEENIETISKAESDLLPDWASDDEYLEEVF